MEKTIRMHLDGPNAAGGSENNSSDQEGEEIMNTLLSALSYFTLDVILH